MAAVGDGGGRLGLKDNKKKTKERTRVTNNNGTKKHTNLTKQIIE
jgi:hypothetical protein